jgi:RHS repeat-associated protein
LRQNEQLGFGFDAAHNLHSRNNGALSQVFNTDAANELTNVTRTGTFTVSGATPAPATSVTVNGQAAQTYGDFTFARTNLSLLDGQNIFTNIAVNLYGVTVTNTLTVNLPQSVSLRFDSNGNLTNDGAKTLSYDAENQLTNVTVPNYLKKDFVYDGLNRLRIKREYGWNGSSWTKTNEVRYVWDGNVIIQLRDSNNVPTLTLTRGLDLSGTLQGAGGIGGLLAMTDSSGANYYYHEDAVGSVTALMDAYENIVGRRTYDAFGRTLRLTGSKTGVNPFWYSSQLHDEDTDFYHYKHRVYLTYPTRFANQDPIGENGGINLYRAVGNNPLFYIDPYGLAFGDYWDINATANYYNQVSATGLSQGGFGGYAKFAGAQLGEDLMDLFGAGNVQQSAHKSGTASADPCHHGAALGYGALTAGMILMNAIPGEGKAAEMTADQIALKELVEEATLGGRKALNAADTEAVMQWAKETQYPGYRASPGDLANPSNWKANPVPHITMPGTGRSGGHIPVTPP